MSWFSFFVFFCADCVIFRAKGVDIGLAAMNICLSRGVWLGPAGSRGIGFARLKAMAGKFWVCRKVVDLGRECVKKTCIFCNFL